MACACVSAKFVAELQCRRGAGVGRRFNKDVRRHTAQLLSIVDQHPHRVNTEALRPIWPSQECTPLRIANYVFSKRAAKKKELNGS